MQPPDMRLDAFITVRDWLRHAVSRFNAAGLSYGHGTADAVDEAAFLVLETLRLPVDQLQPWLDARLTMPERTALRDVIEARVSTRKPAPYLTQSAYIQGHRFFVDERVIVPRSFIGELMCNDGFEGLIADAGAVTSLLDLCTGGGSLAILAALNFPAASIVASDISEVALAVARRNVADYHLEQRIAVIQSDLYAGLGSRRFDLIVSNPPYVTDAAVAAFPPEHRAEPGLAHAGGADGLDIVRRIVTGARQHLSPHGILIVEIGQGQAALEAVFPSLPFAWLQTAETNGEVFAITAAELDARPPPAARKSRR